MALKLPGTVRLDPSDIFVYSRAAEPGEWAVIGSFLFFGADVAKLAGKERQTFPAGFLGVDSFGWSTPVVVTEASADERAAAVDRLARQRVARCGASDLELARAAAEAEIAFAQSLCDHAPGTLLGVQRTAEGECVRESFRTLLRRADGLEPVSAFRFIEVEEERPAEEVDLAALARTRQA